MVVGPQGAEPPAPYAIVAVSITNDNDYASETYSFTAS